MIVGKKFLAVKKLKQAKVEWQPKQESTYSLLWGQMKGEMLSMKMMMSENQSSWGGQFSPYTSHMIGEREELDGQHGHIIGQGWDSHLLTDYSCETGLQQCTCI
jgi:hypothetical protein